MEIDAQNLAARLRNYLPDDYSRRMFDGTWRAFSDEDNPLRLTFFSLGVREMVGHVFHLLAPDHDVRKCDWFVQEHTTITRQQRVKYMVQGGLSDAFLQSSSIDMIALYSSVRPKIDALSKHVHVRENTADVSPETILSVVCDTLAFLVNLFDGIRDCRKKVTDMLEETIHEETAMALVTENLDVDVLSSTHSVETVDVSSIAITDIDHEIVKWRVQGEVGIDFYWGPSNDGIDGNEAFPFEMTMWSFVDDLQRFEDIEVMVDASEWQAQFYDDPD